MENDTTLNFEIPINGEMSLKVNGDTSVDIKIKMADNGGEMRAYISITPTTSLSPLQTDDAPLSSIADRINSLGYKQITGHYRGVSEYGFRYRTYYNGWEVPEGEEIPGGKNWYEFFRWLESQKKDSGAHTIVWRIRPELRRGKIYFRMHLLY